MYVGRDGQPISREEGMAAFTDDDARRVGGDHVHGHYISTVWLVIDHGFGGTPIPFETMIFSEHEGDCALDQWQERYPTEDAARAGHDQALALARDASCGGDS